MPHYDFLCNACKLVFSTAMSLAEYGKHKLRCPRCGSKQVEQTGSVIVAITSKKSAASGSC